MTELRFAVEVIGVWLATRTFVSRKSSGGEGAKTVKERAVKSGGGETLGKIKLEVRGIAGERADVVDGICAHHRRSEREVRPIRVIGRALGDFAIEGDVVLGVTFKVRVQSVRLFTDRRCANLATGNA